jgi:hypothetical protein
LFLCSCLVSPDDLAFDKSQTPPTNYDSFARRPTTTPMKSSQKNSGSSRASKLCKSFSGARATPARFELLVRSVSHPRSIARDSSRRWLAASTNTRLLNTCRYYRSTITLTISNIDVYAVPTAEATEPAFPQALKIFLPKKPAEATPPKAQLTNIASVGQLQGKTFAPHGYRTLAILTHECKSGAATGRYCRDPLQNVLVVLGFVLDGRTFENHARELLFAGSIPTLHGVTLAQALARQEMAMFIYS